VKNVWVATGNHHKKLEIQQILGPSFLVRSFEDLSEPPTVSEDGNNYYENALKKARALFEVVKEPVFADDSGLEVDALDGAPGIYSSRYAGEEGNHEKNIAKLLAEISDVSLESRTARFRCVIVLLKPGEKISSFEGILEGKIGFKKCGQKGFGYDPVFIPEGYDCTAAELDANEKNRISHRGKAMAQLKEFLRLP
jgi:XTP/dITP diphosphohydrolase